MSAGTITITAGRPNREGEEKDFSGPDGTYTGHPRRGQRRGHREVDPRRRQGRRHLDVPRLDLRHRRWGVRRPGHRQARQRPLDRSQVEAVRPRGRLRRADPAGGRQHRHPEAPRGAPGAGLDRRPTTTATPRSTRSWRCRCRLLRRPAPAPPAAAPAPVTSPASLRARIEQADQPQASPDDDLGF